jgi:hypothetical protein
MPLLKGVLESASSNDGRVTNPSNSKPTTEFRLGSSVAVIPVTEEEIVLGD